MANKKLTGIERTMRALNFEETDRMPIVGGFVRHPEFLAEVSGVSVEDYWKNPRKVAIEAFRKLGADLILSLILPDKKSKTGSQDEISKSTDYKSPEDVVKYIETLPSLDEVRKNFNFNKTYNDYVTLMKDGQEEMGDMLWIPGQINACCPSFQKWITCENSLMALLLYPESMKKYFRYAAEYVYLRNEAIAEATIKNGLAPFIWTGSDICDNRGPVVSPDVLNEVYFPYLKKALNPLKKADIRIIWHSDGNIMPIVPQLIEVGADGFQGFQEKVGEKVDLDRLAKLKAKSGRKLLLIGSISTVTTLPMESADDVKKEVERCIGIAEKRGGGFLLNSSSSIGPEVPKKNIYALFDYAKKRKFNRNIHSENNGS